MGRGLQQSPQVHVDTGELRATETSYKAEECSSTLLLLRGEAVTRPFLTYKMG